MSNTNINLLSFYEQICYGDCYDKKPCKLCLENAKCLYMAQWFKSLDKKISDNNKIISDLASSVNKLIKLQIDEKERENVKRAMAALTDDIKSEK
jgi:hypothetical protein